MFRNFSLPIWSVWVLSPLTGKSWGLPVCTVPPVQWFLLSISIQSITGLKKKMCHSNGSEMLTHCDWDLHFPNELWPVSSLVIWRSSLKKHLFKLFVHFPIKSFWPYVLTLSLMYNCRCCGYSGLMVIWDLGMIFMSHMHVHKV